ncbi:hypothetical protein AG1IA_07602 [Rhizoctonia solani AG-1 IA]|uniref:Uncharacterized protein n=1 Tax=Thanatephorus cucumeris (strain AG1-IA) TaxID=983506 RepID=L8WJM8_THACA|nr:hypothetical protein AG1IA_07602 [Rhizoctonia solani AG-1 IA]
MVVRNQLQKGRRLMDEPSAYRQGSESTRDQGRLWTLTVTKPALIHKSHISTMINSLVNRPNHVRERQVLVQVILEQARISASPSFEPLLQYVRTLLMTALYLIQRLSL